MSLTRQDKTLIIDCLKTRQQEIHVELSALEKKDQTDSEAYQALDVQFDHLTALKQTFRQM